MAPRLRRERYHLGALGDDGRDAFQAVAHLSARSPVEVISEFERRIGRGTIGNFPGLWYRKSSSSLAWSTSVPGKPIVYTSADSVFQIATHEQVIPIDQALLDVRAGAPDARSASMAVGRVIARPFIGNDPADFTRTERRRDYPLLPPYPNDAPESRRGGSLSLLGRKSMISSPNRRASRARNTPPTMPDSLAATLEFLEEDFQGSDLHHSDRSSDMIYVGTATTPKVMPPP